MGREGELYKYGWGGCGACGGGGAGGAGKWLDGEPEKNLGYLRGIVGSPMVPAAWWYPPGVIGWQQLYNNENIKWEFLISLLEQQKVTTVLVEWWIAVNMDEIKYGMALLLLNK